MFQGLRKVATKLITLGDVRTVNPNQIIISRSTRTVRPPGQCRHFHYMILKETIVFHKCENNLVSYAALYENGSYIRIGPKALTMSMGSYVSITGI